MALFNPNKPNIIDLFDFIHTNRCNPFGRMQPNGSILFAVMHPKKNLGSKGTREENFVLYLAPLDILRTTFLSYMHSKSKSKRWRDEKGEKTYPRLNGLSEMNEGGRRWFYSSVAPER